MCSLMPVGKAFAQSESVPFSSESRQTETDANSASSDTLRQGSGATSNTGQENRLNPASGNFNTGRGAPYLQGQSTFTRQLDAVSLVFSSLHTVGGDSYRFSLSNRISSRFFLFNEEVRNVQNEHIAQMDVGYFLNPWLGFSSNVRTYTFTNTGLRQDLGMIGLWLRPTESITIEPSIGAMFDERSNQKDDGMAWSLKVGVAPFKFEEFIFEPSFFTERADIDPRRYFTTRYGTRSSYRVEDIFDMQAEIWFGNARRDSYQATSLLNRTESNFIESIGSDTTMAYVAFSWPVSKSLIADLEAIGMNNIRKVSNYTMDPASNVVLFDSRSIRQNLDIRAAVTYPSGNIRLRTGINWIFQARESQLINTDGIPADQVRRREDILLNSNFVQSRFEWFTMNQIRFSPRYRLELDMATSILRYDTPDVNSDDRDEFAFLFRSRNQYQIRNDLSAAVTLAGEAFHYVYLFSERSIENNWRRSLRLIPELTWSPNEHFMWRQLFLVRANYTVDDYTIEGRQRADQSSREMAFISGISYDFLPEWTFHADASRSELRIGRLFWKTFQETPIDTLITYDIEIRLARSVGNIYLSSGIRYFYKFDYLQRAVVQPRITENGTTINLPPRIAPGQQITTQWGPVVQIRMPFRSGNEIYINGWYQTQRSRQKLYTEYPEAFRSAYLREESKATKRIFPNLQMAVRFRF